MNLLKLGVGK